MTENRSEEKTIPPVVVTGVTSISHTGRAILILLAQPNNPMIDNGSVLDNTKGLRSSETNDKTGRRLLSFHKAKVRQPYRSRNHYSQKDL